MKSRPILFSAPMVRALLDGTKTQTRRVVKYADPSLIDTDGWPLTDLSECGAGEVRIACPYGQLGDRLWVRETGWERPERTSTMMRAGADTWHQYYYDADLWSESDHNDFKTWGFKRRPSIFMPRWASRITLEITGLRLERLQDISEADARAEGAAPYRLPLHPGFGPFKAGYSNLWESINGPGSWDANPWVWCISFRRIEP